MLSGANFICRFHHWIIFSSCTDDLLSISTVTDIFPASSITSSTTVAMSSLSAIENATRASSSFDLASTSTIVSASINAPSTSQFSSNVKPVAVEEMLETLKTCFPGHMLHSLYNCQNKCMNLSPSKHSSLSGIYKWPFQSLHMKDIINLPK